MATKLKQNPNASKLIDEYINSSSDFAIPIMKKLREIIIKAEPKIIEDWKWGPNYQKNGMVCNFGFSKNHVHFGFFKGALLKDKFNLLTEGKDNLNSRYMKLKTLSDINEKVFIDYIIEAIKLNNKGIAIKEKVITLPKDLKKELQKNNLLDKFEATNFTNRKEYVRWIESAKKIETRKSRIEKAIIKISNGEKFS